MLSKEQEYISAVVSIRVVEHVRIADDEAPEPHASLQEQYEIARLHRPLFQYAGNTPATFAERFPRLMVGAVAVSLIVAAITAEIECLRAMGYCWK